MPEPRPLQANTSAPAGRRPPSASIRIAERPVQVAVGARGVARVQPHDLPGPHLGADGDLARLGVRADEPAHQEVALHVVGLVRVDHDPHQQPAVDEVAVLLGEAVDRLAQLGERGLAGELADDVAVGGRDGQLGADRRGALRDARQHLDAVEAHADRAAVDDLVAEEQRRAVVGRARGGHAAEQRQQRRRLGEEAQDGVGGERERVGEQDRAGGARRGRAAPTARPSPPRAPRRSRGTAAPRRRRARPPTPTRPCPPRSRARR